MPLQPIEGNREAYLLIKRYNNIDFCITLKEQNTKGNPLKASIQLVSPLNRGNNKFVRQYELFHKRIQEQK